ncbi:MAG TPA: hypothetical protein EYG76_03910 [Methanothermococcus okinawensis]|uniref:Cysteine-rich small domain-containing protein n=1 Tax=Methanothermococcus okinawensis TaxID=155863 RepID=A0A832YST2_9EURY|nr:hypothetical protein [Methanothermococcus okinawensis]
MIDLAREHFEKIIKLCGANRDCQYYPCHFEGQVCLWCFCPFYPCYDDELGEFITRRDGSKVWSCMKCPWIHRPEIACEVLKEILEITKDKNISNALNILNNHENIMMEIMRKVRNKSLKDNCNGK